MATEVAASHAGERGKEDMTMHTPKFYDFRDNNATSHLSLSMPPTPKSKTKLAPIACIT
jgi:hypothetical protein